MSTVQQKSVKAIFLKFKVVRVVAGIKSLVIGTSLFSFVRVSLVRVRRFTVMARSLFALLGKFCLGLETKLGIGKGSPEIDKSPGASRKVRLHLRLVVRTPCHPRPGNRSDGIVLSNEPPVNGI